MLVAGTIGLGSQSAVGDSGMRKYWQRVREDEYRPDKEMRARWLKMFFRVAVKAEVLEEGDLPKGYLEDLTSREKAWEL